MDDDRDQAGIRGDELADDAGAGNAAPTPPAEGSGVRGDGLAQDGGGFAPPATDDELAEDSPRGDGLATDA
jgi:hypothetical protein